MYIDEFIDGRLLFLPMRLKFVGEWKALHLVVAYAPTEYTKDVELKQTYFLAKPGRRSRTDFNPKVFVRAENRVRR